MKRRNALGCRLAATTFFALAIFGEAAVQTGAARGADPPVAPEVKLWVGRDVAPGPKVRITLNTRNVPVVHVAAYRLEGPRWLIRRFQMSEPPRKEDPRPHPGGKPAGEWDVRMVTAPEHPNPNQRDIYRSRQVNLPPLPPGVYLVTARGEDRESWSLLNVTNLAVVTKRSPHRLLTWVTDYHTGAPIHGARVTLFQGEEKRVLSGATGPDGVSLLTVGPGDAQTVIVERGNDVAGLPTEMESPDGRVKMHFAMDRPIYRPGQTVSFKAILRRTLGRGYLPVANTEWKVQVRDPKETVLDTFTRSTNEIGTLSGQVELPQQGVPGPYTITLAHGDETEYASFPVAEYRKPEYQATAAPDRPRYLAGEKALFRVNTSYYFGAPVPQARVTYSIRRAPSGLSWGDDREAWFSGGDGNLYPRDTYSANPFVAEGTVFTDDQGQAQIPFSTVANASDAVYSLQFTVQDASRRQVAGSAQVPVYGAALRLGIRSDVLLVPLGGLIPIQVQATDLDGRPASATVTLRVSHSVWDAKMQRYDDRELTRTEVRVPPSGKASARVPAGAGGGLTIRASAPDGSGRTARTEMQVWVGGTDAKTERPSPQPEISLRLDRRAYRPGEVALVSMSRSPRGRPALLTLEGGDLWEYKVVPADRTSFLWRVRTSLTMSPNSYVDAGMWHKGDLLSANAALPVPDESRRLNVRVTPGKKDYRPGEPADYTVATTDTEGRPVSAEVAIAVVDEAIFALHPDTTPEPYTFFWGLRQNGVVSGHSAPGEVSGGAYQRSNDLAPVRKRFLDTAFWSAHVRTGPDGTAHISFEIPGNLTAWRATALAVTGDTRVGRSTALVRVSRPVMLTLATPRLLVRGDRLTLRGVVRNRTEHEHVFRAELECRGARILDRPAESVTVPAGGERNVDWTLLADQLTKGEPVRISGRVYAADVPASERRELSDALEVGVRVVPQGIASRSVEAGTLSQEREVRLVLPAGIVPDATSLTLSLHAGIGQIATDLAGAFLQQSPFHTVDAANQLLALVAAPRNAPRTVRDAVARLSRGQNPDGNWGWWDNSGSDPAVTAYVLRAVAAARGTGISIPDKMLERGMIGARNEYNRTNLWDHRALLAAALADAGSADAGNLLAEVRRRGTHLSPLALLRLAEVSEKESADARLNSIRSVLDAAVEGPRTAYIPAGDHPGWSGTDGEVTAEALLLLVRLDREPELQVRLAQWLAYGEECGPTSSQDQALTTLALAAYGRRHPGPQQPGSAVAVVNGTRIDVAPPGGERPFRVPLSTAMLHPGENVIRLSREGPGEVFFSLEAQFYQPAPLEEAHGLRVIRRLEARNTFGNWREVNGPIRTADPLRLTVLVWPDDRGGAVQVTEPIPAGFELAQVEGAGAEEIRDGTVVDYVRSHGEPVTLRYYFRAESEGELTLLPAFAEMLERPALHGNSRQNTLSVKAVDAGTGRQP